MGFRRRTVRYLLPVAYAAFFSIALTAQSQPASSAAAVPLLTEQQRMGEALFLQYCPLCHAPQKKRGKDPNEKGTPREKSLAGLFRGGRVQDAVVRQFIQQGIPQKMPGFQYALTPKELDDLIEYLKTL